MIILKTNSGSIGNEYGYSFFIVALLTFSLLLSPFLAMGLIGFYKKKYLLNAMGCGFLVWISITFAIMVANYVSANQKEALAIWLISIFISGFLVNFYKLTRSLFLLSFLIGPFAVLYYLIYGMYKKNIDTVKI